MIFPPFFSQPHSFDFLYGWCSYISLCKQTSRPSLIFFLSLNTSLLFCSPFITIITIGSRMEEGNLICLLFFYSNPRLVYHNFLTIHCITTSFHNMFSNLKQSLITFEYVPKPTKIHRKKRSIVQKKKLAPAHQKRKGNTLWRTRKGARNLSLQLKEDSGATTLANSHLVQRESSFSLADREDADLIFRLIGNLHL
jgi:hypothetical protein